LPGAAGEDVTHQPYLALKVAESPRCAIGIDKLKVTVNQALYLRGIPACINNQVGTADFPEY
jgi:hypothetical protein